MKTSLRSPFPAHWHRFVAVLPAQCRRGSSAVITPCRTPAPCGVESSPGCGDGARPSQAAPRSNSMPPTETTAPACCCPPSRCWLKCSRPLAPHSGTGGRGAFWIIIMLLRCHLQHKTGMLTIPPTCERFSLQLNWKFLTVMVLFSHLLQSTKRRAKGLTFGLCQKAARE